MGDDNENLPKDPAGRLLALLLDVRSRKQDTNVAEAWRTTLGLEPGGGVDAELLTAYADVLTLPSQIRQQTEDLEPRHSEMRLKHMGVIEQVLQIQFHAKVTNLQSRLSAEAITALEHLSPLLAEHSETAPLSAETLDSLMQEISTLLDYVTGASDVDDALRLLLINHLEAMQGAVRRCRVLGPEALHEALKGMVGGLLIHAKTGGKSAGTKTSSQVWTVLTRVALVLGVIKGGYEVATGIAWPALEAGDSIIEDHLTHDDEIVDAEIVDSDLSSDE